MVSATTQSERGVLEKTVIRALSGSGAHVEAKSVFEGLDWKLAGLRPHEVEHSVFQLLNHMIYWQEWVVKWLDREEPPIPDHDAASWPGTTAPATGQEWERAKRFFATGLDTLMRQASESNLSLVRVEAEEKSRLEMLHTVGSHNSYHIGQVVIVRKLLGTWPPPTGGLTW